MKGAGDQRFSRSAFAGNQHGRLRIGHAVDHVVDALHAVVMADDVVQPVPQIKLLLQVFVFLHHAALRQSPLNRHFQFFIDQRFGQQVEGAGSQCIDAGIDGAVACQQNHGLLGTQLLDFRQ